jgi:hypothetical protein
MKGVNIVSTCRNSEFGPNPDGLSGSMSDKNVMTAA